MARRGRGEGNIYQRDDGRWAARMRLGDGKRKWFYGKTREEVRKKLISALNDQQKGLPIVNERQTLGQFLTRWLEDSVKPTVRPRTHVGYETLIRVHVAPHPINKRSLAKLSPQELQALLNKVLAEGRSPRTVQYLHAVLRSALGQALKWGLVGRNVALLVDAPRVTRKEIAPLTPEQVGQFLDAMRDDRFEALYTIAVACGLRQGEVLGLHWRDVDLDTGSLRVKTALQLVHGKLIFTEPKTDRSRRTIAVPELAVIALQKHRKRQLEERLLIGCEWQEDDLVFTTQTGRPLHPRNVVRSFKRLLVKAGLPNIRFHDLRHTCATLLLVQGEQPRTIMEVLGHSQISLTMNTYAHVMPAVKREAAEKMDAILRKHSS